MMGSNERSFAPLINVSLEELVPQGHFYRHLERTLDLSLMGSDRGLELSRIRRAAYRGSSIACSGRPCQILIHRI